MLRGLRCSAAVVFAALAMPTSAFADDGGATPISWVRIVVSLIGLLVAVLLLVEALGVRKVALGGAIADKISYVVLAILCLASSAIAQWAGNFVAGVTLAETQLASQVLVVAAMLLLAVYFYSVRTAMQRYLKSMTGAQHLAEEMADEWQRSRDVSEPSSAEAASSHAGDPKDAHIA